jgi:hypothetical protein
MCSPVGARARAVRERYQPMRRSPEWSGSQVLRRWRAGARRRRARGRWRPHGADSLRRWWDRSAPCGRPSPRSWRGSWRSSRVPALWRGRCAAARRAWLLRRRRHRPMTGGGPPGAARRVWLAPPWWARRHVRWSRAARPTGSPRRAARPGALRAAVTGPPPAPRATPAARARTRGRSCGRMGPRGRGRRGPRGAGGRARRDRAPPR